MPRELQHFDQSLLAAMFFVSNIYFYATTGYFAAQPDSLPLLHTWSLSIEEQFYIVFPLLLSVALRFGRRVWVWLIAALFLLSLAASIWVTRVNPDAAFYLAPMRVWELMLGALLAARLVPRIEAQAVREMLALAGVALIAYAVFRFSPATPFPGSAALIPCLGVTVSRLLAAGKTVVLVYPVPEIGFVVPPAVGRLIARGGDPQSLNLPLASFMQRQDVVLSALDHAGTSQRIFRVYPHKRLCNATECLVFAGGRSLYRDDDHLSSAGVDLVLPEFGSILEAGGGSVETAQTGRRH
jgi:hypothetical protein